MRLRPFAFVLVAVLALPSAARAQESPRPRVHPDSIPVDTTPPVAFPSIPRLLFGVVAGTGATMLAVAAPSAVLLYPEPLRLRAGDSTDAGSPMHTVRTWASAGTGPGIGARRRADWSGTAAVGLEVLTHGAYVDARWEHVWIPERIELRSAHVGWLAHPRGGLLGGVIVGYRDARGAGVLRGVDVGFPLVIAGADGSWTRLEPSYVIGDGGTGYTMSYRFEMSPPRAAGAWWPSLALEARGFDENDGLVALSARYGVRQALR